MSKQQVLTFGLAMCLLVGFSATRADEINSPDPALERIEVTARGRVETLQSVPDSITAFSSKDIQAARISSLSDLAALTPNLGALDNFRPGLTRINIRGLITPQVGDAPLAFVVDGVTAPDIEFINQGLVDIERIEVMRGAQGALYGRGAIGGAVLITTKRPGDELEGKVNLDIGNGEKRALDAVLTGQLGHLDDAYFRVGGRISRFNGLIDNTFSGTKADGLDEDAAFGQLQFDLFDFTVLTLNAKYANTEAGFAYYQPIEADQLNDFSIVTSQNIMNLDEREVVELSAHLSQMYDLGELEVILASSRSSDQHFYDGDYTADPTVIFDGDFLLRAPFASAGKNDVDAWTVETRFTAEPVDKFRWSLSAFYQDKERDNQIDFLDDIPGDVQKKRADFSDSDVYLTIADINSSQAWAVAGQANIDVTSKLELTLALRYDSDSRESYDPFNAEETFAKKRFDQWQPKVSLAYQLSNEQLIYAGYSKGFRSGGFNEPAPDISRTFDKELSDSYELGMKDSYWSGAVSLNASVFYIEQANAQITQFNVDTLTLENLGIDEVEIKGAEVEVNYAISSSLSTRVGFGIVDSEIIEFDSFPTLEGLSQVWVSDYNASAALNYSGEIGENWLLDSHIGISLIGPRYYNIDAPELKTGSAAFVNANVRLTCDDWHFQLYADNLFDKRMAEDVFLLGDGVSEFVRQPNTPRQFGVELGYQF